ncbi:MAG: helix-turn-helix transcriptional regulator [Pseudomonadota bacterium]
MEDLIRHVGHRVQDARRMRKLTQEQLAERSGLAPPTLSRIERGRQAPSLRALERIAEALGVSVASLVTLDEDRLPSDDAISALLAGLPAGEAALRERLREAMRVLAGQ